MARENDIVLIHMEDTPVAFARVESISPDYKKDWYHIKLLMLQIPLQVVVWTLKDIYINGGEFFMGGKKMKLEVVECPEEADPADPGGGDGDDSEEGFSKGSGKIVSLADIKRAKNKSGSTKP